MKLFEVKNAKQEREFIKVAVQLYQGHPKWIRPLDKDVFSVFNLSKNHLAKADSYKRWILKNEKGELCGRIAAFINSKTAYISEDYSVGGIGFFECINDLKAATLLFDAARDWLQKRGLEAMEGPINFGDRDKFWGLLSEGFELEPNYLANYNFPYYKELFDNYGFKCYFKQFTFSRSIQTALKEDYIKKAKSVLNKPGFEFKHIKKKELGKFTEDFKNIYNKAWAGHQGVSEMTSLKAKSIIASIKPVIDEKTAWFCYYRKKPIAFFIMIPEVNQIFKHLDGKLDLRGKLIYLYHLIRKRNTKLLGIIFGVIPEFDGKGVSNAITYVTQQSLKNYKNYQYVEMHGIGDFNPAMIKFIHKTGELTKSKEHTTFRYLFDRERTFERMPIKKNFRRN